MNKEFVDYSTALELKELGFDEPCWGHYTSSGVLQTVEDYNRLGVSISEMISKDFNSESFMKEICKAPLYQQAFRWFRKNHGLYSSIIFKKSYPDNYVTGLEWYIIICGGDGVLFDTDGTYTYEEAELACLKKLIEIIKNK